MSPFRLPAAVVAGVAWVTAPAFAPAFAQQPAPPPQPRAQAQAAAPAPAGNGNAAAAVRSQIQSVATARNVAGTSSAVSIGKPFALYTGEIQVLDLPNVARIAVGTGAVLRAQVIDARQVVLIGEQAGTTSLHLWQEDGSQYRYEVTVRGDNAARVASDVQGLLIDDPEVRVRTVGSRVIVEGDASNPRTSQRLQAVLKMYPQVVNMTEARPPQVRVLQDKTVLLDVRVVEVRKRALERLGIKWSESAAGPGFIGSGYFSANTPFKGPPLDPSAPNSAPTDLRRFSSWFGIATSIGSVLNFLEQGGDSWTLAEPKLSCKSGGEAKFVVGGEIPIPVAAGFGQVNVVYKQYGVILEFRPVADNEGNVASKIVAEVSEPDTRNSNQGFVAFTQNRTETEVTLRENETLVISGLLKHRGTNSSDGIPGLASIPILGNLFKSKEFINEKTELVVMVTPRVITAQSTVNTDLVERGTRQATGVTNVIGKYMAD